MRGFIRKQATGYNERQNITEVVRNTKLKTAIRSQEDPINCLIINITFI
jgi:hypothetical protein